VEKHPAQTSFPFCAWAFSEQVSLFRPVSGMKGTGMRNSLNTIYAWTASLMVICVPLLASLSVGPLLARFRVVPHFVIAILIVLSPILWLMMLQDPRIMATRFGKWLTAIVEWRPFP
jgi:hypothetical protein